MVNTNIFNACRTPSPNIYDTNTPMSGAMLMANTDIRPDHTSCGSMRIIFEFPSKSSTDELIKREVDSILRSALHEQLQHKPS